jgi:hypothetical protein
MNDGYIILLPIAFGSFILSRPVQPRHPGNAKKAIPVGNRNHDMNAKKYVA